MTVNTETGEITEALTLNYEIHPAASIFPLIEGREFAALVEDIRVKGQIEPVVLDKEGRLIDGRNRARACQVLDIDVKETRYDGDDVTGYVVSKNLLRRQLTVPQQAMCAARLANLPQGGTGANQYRGRAETPIGVSAKSHTRSEVKNLLHVSEGSLQRAKEITRTGTPALIALADEGKVSLAGAADVAKAEPAVQDAWVKETREGTKPPKPLRETRAPESTYSEQHAAKWDHIAALAASGSTTRQIAHEVGMGEEGVKAGAKQRGIDIRADRVVGRTRRLDSNRIIRESVDALENIINGLVLVNYDDIDMEEADEWTGSLEKSRTALSQAITQIKKRKPIQ